MVLDPNEVEPNPRLQITGGKKRCRERSTLCSRRERREHRPYTRDAAASKHDDIALKPGEMGKFINKNFNLPV